MIETIDVWGEPKQPYYEKGRKIKSIMRSQIEGICDCGYITLKPINLFETRNGGLTVKRSKVQIFDDKTGKEILKLRPKKYGNYYDINLYGSCNACDNHWK